MDTTTGALRVVPTLSYTDNAALGVINNTNGTALNTSGIFKDTTLFKVGHIKLSNFALLNLILNLKK